MSNKYEHLRVPKDKSCVEEIIPTQDDTKIKEELLSVHSINPFTHHNSSQRNYMFSLHFSQAIVLPDGEPNIIQSGVDNQLGLYTFGAEVEKKCTVMGIVKKYESLDENFVDAVTQQYILVYNIEENELDLIICDNNHSGLHQNNGFQYVWTKKLNNLRVGQILEAGEKLTHSPSLKGGSYGFGVNVNTVIMSHPDVAEDGVVISESLAKKLRYNIYETKTINYGTEMFPLNIYGDEKNYKGFPEIGELINEDSVVMALRDFEDINLNKTDQMDFTPGLLSNKETREFDPEFDYCVYARGPGKLIDIGYNKSEISGVVVDINVFKNEKKVPKVYTPVDDVADKYHRSYLKFAREFVDLYSRSLEELKARKPKISPRLHQQIVHFGIVDYDYNLKRIKLNYKNIYNKLVTAPLPSKISTSFKNEKLDSYRIEITIKYTVPLIKGNKLTDFNGGKGVSVVIKPDHLMPFNEYGRADMIVDSTSVFSRMNISRLYSPYFCLVSRYCQYNLRKMVNGRDIYSLPENEIEEMFTYIMGLLGKIDTPQFDAYAKATMNEKRDIIKEAIDEELYLMFKVNNNKTSYQIQQDIKNSEYRPPLTQITIPMEQEDGTIKYIKSKKPIYIYPLYSIVLNKSSDNMNYTYSPDLNIFGLPNSVTSANKDRMPYRRSAVRTLSETETRLYAVTGGRRAIAELKDMANSIPTHIAMCENILKADTPSNMDVVVDRTVNKFGYDSGLNLLKATFNMFGLGYRYK